VKRYLDKQLKRRIEVIVDHVEIALDKIALFEVGVKLFGLPGKQNARSAIMTR
jgi:hypothetical protein